MNEETQNIEQIQQEVEAKMLSVQEQLDADEDNPENSNDSSSIALKALTPLASGLCSTISKMIPELEPELKNIQQALNSNPDEIDIDSLESAAQALAAKVPEQDDDIEDSKSEEENNNNGTIIIGPNDEERKRLAAAKLNPEINSKEIETRVQELFAKQITENEEFEKAIELIEEKSAAYSQSKEKQREEENTELQQETEIRIKNKQELDQQRDQDSQAKKATEAQEAAEAAQKLADLQEEIRVAKVELSANVKIAQNDLNIAKSRVANSKEATALAITAETEAQKYQAIANRSKAIADAPENEEDKDIQDKARTDAATAAERREIAKAAQARATDLRNEASTAITQAQTSAKIADDSAQRLKKAEDALRNPSAILKIKEETNMLVSAPSGSTIKASKTDSPKEANEQYENLHPMTNTIRPKFKPSNAPTEAQRHTEDAIKVAIGVLVLLFKLLTELLRLRIKIKNDEIMRASTKLAINKYFDEETPEAENEVRNLVSAGMIGGKQGKRKIKAQELQDIAKKRQEEMATINDNPEAKKKLEAQWAKEDSFKTKEELNAIRYQLPMKVDRDRFKEQCKKLEEKYKDEPQKLQKIYEASKELLDRYSNELIANEKAWATNKDKGRGQHSERRNRLNAKIEHLNDSREFLDKNLEEIKARNKSDELKAQADAKEAEKIKAELGEHQQQVNDDPAPLPSIEDEQRDGNLISSTLDNAPKLEQNTGNIPDAPTFTSGNSTYPSNEDMQELNARYDKPIDINDVPENDRFLAKFQAAEILRENCEQKKNLNSDDEGGNHRTCKP